MIDGLRRAACACVLTSTLTPLLLGQGQSERARALENGTRVPTCDEVLQRTLTKGLQQLQKSEGRNALQTLLAACSPTGPRPQLRWGKRETRDFFELLTALLREVPEPTRKAFTATIEVDADKAFELALADTAQRRRRLKMLLRAFPGTEASSRARLVLVDLAIERGDALEALRYAPDLESADRERRQSALDALAGDMRASDPWPHVSGDATGLALGGARRAPPKKAPKLLGSWPQRVPWDPNRARGVVGSLPGQPPIQVAVFQDPFRFVAVIDRPGDPRLDRVDLTRATGLRGDPSRVPSPAMLGNRVFLVHGGGLPSTVPPRADAKAPAAEIFAFDVDRGATKLVWRFDPHTRNEFGTDSTMLPGLCATGDRVYALVAVEEDRLTRRVHACCFDADGNLIWQQRLAKGATLTADLLMHRQEAVRAGRIDPAAPVLRDGRLHCETGLGITACLDATDGTMLWSFRTARLGKLRGRESSWIHGKLVADRDHLWLAPSDGTHSYRLHARPGPGDLLTRLPEPRGKRTHFVGISTDHNASIWWRRGLLDSAVQRALLVKDPNRDSLYEAPPLDRGDRLVATPLLTKTSLVYASGRTLAWLDLEKDLFYERIFDLSSVGRAGFGPALPFRDGVIFACDIGALYWGP